MRTKAHQVFAVSSQSDFDIIVLVETWLNSDFFDEEFFDTSTYHVYRKDRDYSKANCVKGGGVIIAVKRNLISSLCILPNTDSIMDQLCIAMSGVSGNIILNVSYIPPHSSDVLYDAHIQNIVSLTTRYCDYEIVIFGDFNLSTVNWSLLPESEFLSPSNVNRTFEINVIDSFFSLDLVQVNKCFNRLGKILDLVFISKDLKFLIDECVFPFCKSDMHHVALELKFEFYYFSKVNDNVFNGYDFKNCNFNHINLLILEVNWMQMLNDRNASDCYDIFVNIINEICVSNVPLLKPKIHKLPWYTKGLKKLKNLRNKHYKLFKSTDSLNHKQLYEHYLREFNFLNKFLYKQYIIGFENSIKENPKSFWNFIKSKRTSSEYPSKMFYNDKISNSSSETANLFAEFFCSNFVLDANFDVVSNSTSSSCLNFGNLQLYEDDIFFGISKLKPAHKIDNDGISAFFIKNCANSLIVPLLQIFNTSLRQGVFVDKWKVTSITPVFKSGPKDNIANYRPISKLCNISKIFEHIVFEKIYFSVKSIISADQHGFVRGRSTATNLAIFSQYCLMNIELGFQIDTIYTDLSKAFDRLSHKILLYKLQLLGFHSTFLNWIKSYLLNRICFVSVDSDKSCPYIATSGVPQGSIIGPLLFLLFINDISTKVKWSKVLLYADDLKIFLKVKSLVDFLHLQEDLDVIGSWCCENLLDINISKCKHVCFSKSRNPILNSYSINNVGLNTVDEIMDLGVIFDNQFTFANHINYIIPKAYSLLAFIKRNCRDFSDLYTLKLVYTSLVRSKLEYGSLIWSPFYDNHIGRLERIQKKFIKFAFRFIQFFEPYPVYIDKCRFIHLETLENRRAHLLVMFLYKIICGIVDCPILLKTVNFKIPDLRLRRNDVFVVQAHRTNYASNEPIIRALNEFNRISNTWALEDCDKLSHLKLDFSDSLSTFCNMLDLIYF